jgi:hypothetical protein
MSIFGQVWLWSLVAFVIGALITWLVLVRPAQRRVRELESGLADAQARERAAAWQDTRFEQAPVSRVDGPTRTYTAPEPGHYDRTLLEPEAEPEPYERAYERETYESRPQPRPHEAGGEREWKSEAPAVPVPVQESYPEPEPEPVAVAAGPVDVAADEEGQERDWFFGEEEPERHTAGEPAREAADDPAGHEDVAGVESRAADELAGPERSSYLAEAEPTQYYHPTEDEPSVADDVPAQPETAQEREPVTQSVAPESESLPKRTESEREPRFDWGAMSDEPDGALFENESTDSLKHPGTQQAQPAEQEPAPEEHRAPEPAAATETPVYAFGGGPAKEPPGGAESATESTQVLPKRQRRAPVGFEQPRPMQPSMRAVERREPLPDSDSESGSLFEPSVPTGHSGASAGEATAPAPPPARPYTASSVPPGPFGPGSAMPRPGGASPSAEFQVKASVTALRYCTEESSQFNRMVAEVWFRTPADAERVGFRPIG